MNIEILKVEGYAYDKQLKNVVKNAIILAKEFDDSENPGEATRFTENVNFIPPDPENFIPIENLTKELIVSWVTGNEELMKKLDFKLQSIKAKSKKITFEL